MADYLVRQLFREMPEADLSGVTVKGWVRTARESKTFAFIELNDGSFFRNLQIVLEEERVRDYRDVLKKIGVGAALSVQAGSARHPCRRALGRRAGAPGHRPLDASPRRCAAAG